MAVTALSDFFYQLHETWIRHGPPKEVFLESGKFCKLVKKGYMKARWAGKNTMLVPIRTQLDGGAGGSEFEQVYALARPSVGAQFQVPARESWAVMNIDWQTLDFASQPGVLEAEKSAKRQEMMDKATGWLHGLSYRYWSDGTGRIAKGDGAFNVATQAGALLNRQAALRIKVGDRLVAIDQGAAVPASGQPTPRAGFVTVASVNQIAGTFTISEASFDDAGAIPAIVNTDYFGKQVDFVGAGQTAGQGLIDGVFRWLPITATEANTTWAGVARAGAQELSGIRFKLQGSETLYDICVRILRHARDYGATIDTIWIPSLRNEDLSSQLAGHNVSVSKVEMGPEVRKMTYGLTAAYVVFPDHGPVTILSDPFLCDINVTESNDFTAVGMNLANWTHETTPSGVGWKNYAGHAGSGLQIAGKQQVTHAYGAFGNLCCDRIGHQIVGSTRAEL